MAARMRCRVVAALGFAVIALAIGCRGASDSATATATTPTTATPTTAATTTTAVSPSGRDVPGSAPTGGTAPTATGVDRSEVRPLSITVEDPAVGALTFDALTAGDPQAVSDGRLVVLLHGFPEAWFGWRFQIPALAEAGFRVVAPDLRGFNLSSKPKGVSAYAVSYTHLTLPTNREV